MVNVKAIRTFINANGVKSILPTTPQKVVDINGLKYNPLKSDVFQLNTPRSQFEHNWNTVFEKTQKYNPEFGVVKTLLALLTPEEKVLAGFKGNDFSAATQHYLRDGNQHRRFTWSADHWFTEDVILKYKDCLNFVLKNGNLEKYNGISFRWQPFNSLGKKYGNLKQGDIITEKAFLPTAENLKSADRFRHDLNCRANPPELLIVNGKSGKVIPEKCCGKMYGSEKEVLYPSDTKYRVVKEKIIDSPDELEGFKEIVEDAMKIDGSRKFKNYKVIYLEEV